MRTPLGDMVDAVRKKSHCVRRALAGQNEEMVENMPHYIYAFHGKYRLYEDDRQVNAGHRFHSGVRTINGVTRIATNVLELLDVSLFTRRQDELVAKKKQ